MPFIQIKSLPFREGLEMTSILAAIGRDFSEQIGIDLEEVTITWEYLPPWHYAAAGWTAASQPVDTHPILVDLLIPDFNPPAAIEKMLECIASCIAKRVTVSRKNIFIHARQAESGRVFDAGEIVRW